FIENSETTPQFFMIVGGKIARLDLQRESGQRAGQGRQEAEELLRMHSSSLIVVTQDRQLTVDRIEQPEARDIRGREICQTGAPLTASASQYVAFGGQDFHKPAGYI